jgi:hypothetical protein|tara:strand:+ start:645 stop:1070 length:426 start_codon:yes stop_codon:yes gene_type:complete
LNSYTETFNQTDIDPKRLYDRAFKESEKITWNPNNRSKQRILEDCMMGQCAELFLIDKCGFTDNPNGFMDVYDPVGNEIEVKVTRGEHNVKFMLGDLLVRKVEWGYDVADIVYTYLYDPKSGDYTFLNDYKFNGTDYVLSR